jgi:hypothetical protein
MPGICVNVINIVLANVLVCFVGIKYFDTSIPFQSYHNQVKLDVILIV